MKNESEKVNLKRKYKWSWKGILDEKYIRKHLKYVKAMA